MGAVNTSYTFSSSDTITSAKMNNIIDQTTFTNDAILGTTLEVATGKLKIRSQGITSNEMGSNSVKAISLESNAVTTEKIANGSITNTKLGSNAVTSVKIADLAITPAKIAEPLTLMTSVSLSSNPTDITGIPSWAKRITLILSEVKMTGSDQLLVQIGSSGILLESGYTSGSRNASNATNGFIVRIDSSNRSLNGSMTLFRHSGNVWIQSHAGNAGTDFDIVGGGIAPELGGTLNIIRLKPSGSNGFASGAISVMYE